MLLGDIIKQYREEHQMSLQDFANLIGTSRSYIHMLEKNINPSTNKPISPSIETLKLLAKAMNMDLEFLLKQLNSNQKIYLDENKYNEQFNKTDALGNPVVSIPILGTVKAGYDYLAQENWIGAVDVDKKLADGNELFALKVHGDSMSPVLIEDDIVIIKKQDDFENGDIVVAIVNGDEATIKKGKKNENSILLQPLNPSYEPLIFTYDEMESIPVKIIGIVKQLKREF
jgi:repressor LexA